MSKLKKIDLLFAAKLSAFFSASIGLLCGIAYAFGGFFYEAATSSLNVGTGLAFGALIGMPLMFGLCGFLTGGIGAVFYNLWARRFGGISSGFTVD